MKILDSSFLIQLQREWARGEEGAARRFLVRGDKEEYGISVITALEFLEGYAQVADGERFLEPFPQLEVTAGVARTASRIRRDLRRRGELIGDFDILIAATALVAGLPLISDNAQHFERVEGLVVERYR